MTPSKTSRHHKMKVLVPIASTYFYGLTILLSPIVRGSIEFVHEMSLAAPSSMRRWWFASWMKKKIPHPPLILRRVRPINISRFLFLE